jgi:hypothetical protein
MKIKHILPWIGAAALFCACIPSLNPFYTEKDVIKDPRLVREWKNVSEPESTWTFETNSKGTYTLSETLKDNKSGRYTAVLFKIGNDTFLDLIPDKCDYATNQSDMVGASMFPGHLLLRISQMEPTLKTSFFDFDWFSKQLDQNPKLLETHTDDKRVLITASTADLQKFVSAHTRELFSKEDEWTAVTNAPAATK